MKDNSQEEVIEMEHQVANQTQPTGSENNITSQTAITITLSQNQIPRITPRWRVSFSIETTQHSIVTSKELPYIPEEKESNTSKQKISKTVESQEKGEVVRWDVGMEDVGTEDIETGDRFSKSNIERKWSLASGFSNGSKSSRSSIWSGSSNGSIWSIGSSVSLVRSTIHGNVDCIINELFLHSHFLYWPIPAFFLSIILLMVVFIVLALIFS